MHWLALILIFPYVFLLLKIFRSLLKIKPLKSSAHPSTFVSVVVPCRNEQIRLPFLLNSISKQNYPMKLLEVIFVDDNSADNTPEIIKSFFKKGNISLISNEGTGKKQALKTGINSASGGLIITTDADCFMGSEWIRTIVVFFERHKPDMIICPVQLEPLQGFFGKFQELEFLSLQGITAGSATEGDAVMCNGANLVFTRKTYDENSGNLHPEIASGDDMFLLQSLKKKDGSKIMWLESEQAVVTAGATTTVKSYLKQRSRWISKSGYYTDKSAIILGIVTFVTILLQLALLTAVFINKIYLNLFLVFFLLKSVPDYLILANTDRRYGKNLIRWFIPVQIVYPFYVAGVVLTSLIRPEKKH